MSELHPCPFCDGTPEFTQRDALTYHVRCTNCGAQTRPVPLPDYWDAEQEGGSFMDYIEGQATGLWNWRQKQRGRKRALDWERVYRARWLYANTSCSMAQIARNLRVSPGVIQAVIDRTGAYK